MSIRPLFGIVVVALFIASVLMLARYSVWEVLLLQAVVAGVVLMWLYTAARGGRR